MKKLLVIIVVLMISVGASAQNDSFFRSNINDYMYDRTTPSVVGTPTFPDPFDNLNHNADAPLGTGLFLLTTLGAGYAISKRRKEER